MLFNNVFTSLWFAIYSRRSLYISADIATKGTCSAVILPKLVILPA